MKTFKQFLIEDEKDWGEEGLGMHQILAHQKHAKALSEPDRITTARYKSDSGAINGPLRDLHSHTPHGTIMYGDKHLTDAMDRVTSHVLEHDHVAYRGFGDDTQHDEPVPGKASSSKISDAVKKAKPGFKFTDHGYTGGSLNPDEALNFAHYHKPSDTYHIAKIHIPAGTKAQYLPTVTGRHDYEKELLLHRGTKFEVTHHSIEKHPRAIYGSHHPEYKNTKVHVTHLKVVGQKPLPIDNVYPPMKREGQ